MKQVIAVFLLLLVAASVAGATAKALRRFDTSSDNMMQPAELTAYFKSRGASDAEAAGATTDALTAFGCPLPCNSGISIAQAADVVDEVFVPKKDEENKSAPPCKFLSITRTVADTVDPRGKERDFPTVFSYKHDKHADDTSQLNILGAVEAFNCLINPGGDPNLKNVTFNGSFGLDFDIDGSTPPEESTIEASIPLSLSRVSEDDQATFTKLVGTLTPKFSTDRALDREAYEIAASFTFQSPRLARAGLRTFLPNFNNQKVSIWWQPTAFVEWSDIADPAGNTDLAALDKRAFRYGPRLDVILRPVVLSERLAFKFKGFERYGKGDSHSYSESFLTYDFNEDRTAQFTVVYRHGRKPPDFSARDQWLVGIGIQR
jgi:hypothetical protein